MCVQLLSGHTFGTYPGGVAIIMHDRAGGVAREVTPGPSGRLVREGLTTGKKCQQLAAGRPRRIAAHPLAAQALPLGKRACRGRAWLGGASRGGFRRKVAAAAPVPETRHLRPPCSASGNWSGSSDGTKHSKTAKAGGEQTRNGAGLEGQVPGWSMCGMRNTVVSSTMGYAVHRTKEIGENPGCR